jgi:TetR/AcrR family transcriptional regulator
VSKPLKKPNIRDSDATREALMAAGSEQFAAQGYDGVSVETIATRAGVNKAMINYHFGGKRGLYRSILTSTFDEVGTAVRGLAASGQRAHLVIARFLELIAEIASTRRPAFPALFLREALSADRLDREVIPRVGVIVGTLMEVVARGVREGSLRPVDPFCAYFIFMAPMSLFISTEPLRRRAHEEGLLPFAPPSQQTFARQLKDTVLRGMCTDYDKENV